MSDVSASPDPIASTPAFAMAALMTATSNALATAAHNATVAQAAGNTVMLATTAVGVGRILGMTQEQVLQEFEKLVNETK